MTEAEAQDAILGLPEREQRRRALVFVLAEILRVFDTTDNGCWISCDRREDTFVFEFVSGHGERASKLWRETHRELQRLYELRNLQSRQARTQDREEHGKEETYSE